MKTYYNADLLKISGPTACCLGNFDGVHIGHQRLIHELLKYSQKNNLASVVLTFEPHPSKIINPDKSDPLILSLSQKERIIRSHGVDHIIFAAFNEELSKMSCEEFIYNILVEKVKAKIVVVGFDYRFGYKGEGDAELLSKLCFKAGIETVILPPVTYQGKIISSTLIRDLITSGDVKEVKNFMGRLFSVEGTVIKGDGVGRKLGFATANIPFKEDMIVPARGVYAVQVLWQNRFYNGVANIGNKPTFNGKEDKLEVHILDFCQPLYGEKLEVFFVDKLRTEKKFDKVSDLTNQIVQDKIRAKDILTKI